MWKTVANCTRSSGGRACEDQRRLGSAATPAGRAPGIGVIESHRHEHNEGSNHGQFTAVTQGVYDTAALLTQP